MSDPNILNYEASPTIESFMRSDARRRVIMGPFGSGKSSGCCVEVVRRAMQQAAFAGVSKTRFAIVRNTAPQLRDTTIKTWMDWFPNGSIGYWRETGKTYHIRQGGLESEVMFRALDDADDLKNLLSLEITGAYLNECREIVKEIVDGLDGRIGRYPRVLDGGASWRGMWADTNPPEEHSYWYNIIEGNDLETGQPTPDNGWQSFKQPGGMRLDELGRMVSNPDAENIPYLDGGEDYYRNLAKGRNPRSEYVKVYVRGMYGSGKAGKPVHTLFNADYHMSRETLMPNPHRPLIIGADFGLTPAMALKQQDAHGRVLTLAEVWTEDMGLKRAIKTRLKPLLTQRFQGLRVVVMGDPAGRQRSQNDETTCVDTFKAEGFKTVRFPRTNAHLARVAATDEYLETLTDAGPAYQIDPSCTALKRGLESGYHYPVNNKGISSDNPAKNLWSHLCEANQYGDMYFQAGFNDTGDLVDSRTRALIAQTQRRAQAYSRPRQR